MNFLPLKLRKERAGAIKSLKFDELHGNSSANNPKSDTLLGRFIAVVKSSNFHCHIDAGGAGAV
jgi:hypothetical protein